MTDITNEPIPENEHNKRPTLYKISSTSIFMFSPVLIFKR